MNEDGYLTGPPELIVEVASSSASIDLRDKRRAYCRNRVPEYLVWLVAEARLEYLKSLGEMWRAASSLAGFMLEDQWPPAPEREQP